MRAATLPGPPELLPGRPDAVVDLQSHDGVSLVQGTWRYRDAEVRAVDFVRVGEDLGPSGPPTRTYDVVPHAQAPDFDDSAWPVLAPPETQRRLGGGRVCFNWYRIAVTIPRRVGDLDPTGATVVFEVVVDDYAEVWVDGALPLALGQSGGQVVGGFNAPNGLTLDPQGRLVICQHGNRRVVRVEPHGNLTVLADRHHGKRLNSPNDLVFRSDGTLFFSDPPFGLPGGFDDPAKELPFSGVFMVRDGAVTLVTAELEGPNGIALSPDERYLYVGNWDLRRKVVMRYRLDPSGAVSDGTVLHDMTGADGEDAIDGLKVDRAGNLYVCGPGGIWLLSSDGTHLGTLRLPESPHNLAWGDHDARTLYVTALTSIYRLRLNVPGVRPQ